MATNRPSINDFAGGSNSARLQPPTEFMKMGFSGEQPAVEHFNWIIHNLHNWYKFIDANTGQANAFNLKFETTKPRINIPFPLNEDEDKKSQVSVLKLETGTVGAKDAIGSVAGAVQSMSGVWSFSAPSSGAVTKAPGVPSVTFTIPRYSWTPGASSPNKGILSLALGGTYTSPTKNRFTFVAQGLAGATRYFQYRAGPPYSQTAIGSKTNTNREKIQEIVFYPSSYSNTDLRNRYVIYVNSQYLIGQSLKGAHIGATVGEITLDFIPADQLNPQIINNIPPVPDNHQVFISPPLSQSQITAGRAITATNLTEELGVYFANNARLDYTGFPFKMLRITGANQPTANFLTASASYNPTNKTLYWGDTLNPTRVEQSFTFSVFGGTGFLVYNWTPLLASNFSVVEDRGRYYVHITGGVTNNTPVLIRRNRA